MREIKFRGHTGGSWVYGNLIKWKDGSGDIYVWIRVLDDLETWRVDLESVGQFTGLKDRNGVEIFEGDIVKCYFDGHHEQSAVFYEDGCFSIKAYNNDPGYEPCLGLIPELDIEVIGNTFENPNLI